MYRTLLLAKHHELVDQRLEEFLAWYDRTVKKEALYNSKLV